MDSFNENSDVILADLRELRLLREINRAMNSSPECMNVERLIYDEHHHLLVNAFIVKGFINNIHFQENINDEDADYLFHEIIMWLKLMEENKDVSNGARDKYMQEILDGVPFKGFKSPDTYSFIIQVDGNPYIPYWFAIPLAKKALRVLTQRIKGRSDIDV